jgi:predicted transcriptional regulator
MAERPEHAPPALVNYALLLAKRLRAQPRHVVTQRKEKIAALVILEGSAVDKVIEELERLAGKPKPVAKKTRREPT